LRRWDVCPLAILTVVIVGVSLPMSSATADDAFPLITHESEEVDPAW
jgi:hypothetical protein